MSRKFPDFLREQLIAVLLENDFEEDQCFDWPKGKTQEGYGVAYEKGERRVSYYVHRVAFELWLGELPFLAQVNHRCDNPACFNPLHLYSGTHLENMKDKRKKFFKSLNLSRKDFLRIRNHRGTGLREKLSQEYGLTLATIDRLRAGVYDDVS
jgi:hypothetical protein